MSHRGTEAGLTPEVRPSDPSRPCPSRTPHSILHSSIKAHIAIRNFFFNRVVIVILPYRDAICVCSPCIVHYLPPTWYSINVC